MNTHYVRDIETLTGVLGNLDMMGIPWSNPDWCRIKGRWKIGIRLQPGQILSACCECGEVYGMREGCRNTGISHGYCRPCLDRALSEIPGEKVKAYDQS